MGKSKIADSLENIIKTSAKGIGTLQVSVDKILWGNPSPPKENKSSARFENKSNTQPKSFSTTEVAVNTGQGQKSLQYKQVPTKLEKPKPGQKLVASGLYNTLDALNSVDLCNVITYAFDNVNAKSPPRPDRSTWRPDQVAFYTLQDQAKLVTTFIDKYTAYPNVFIGSYLGVGPNAVPPQQAVTQSNAPTQGGIDVQKYNMYFLLQAIGQTFSFNTNTTGSLFTSQDATLLQQVPGLGSNLNFVNDFLGNVSKYTDYRQITVPDLLSLQAKIGKLRSTCVTIQNLNFKNAILLAGNFLGIDIRSQIQKLTEFIDITRIIPTLRDINNAIRSFIKIANQVQRIITTGQFIIKLALLFVKVFKFILYFFGILPVPSMYLTAGAQTKIQDAKNAAKDESDGLVRILKSINALLGVATSFIRYLTVNANELLIRLNTLLTTLEGCEAMKDSDILRELQQTQTDLKTLLDQLATYVIDYDSKTSPDSALFGAYQIRIIDEEVVDLSIKNKRRRGVALDQNGGIVTQSDLTFATNSQVIIEEVKQKLVSLGLVRPELGTIDADTLTVVSESLTYLDNNDILQNDLNISQPIFDTPDNTDESQGLGLNAFINNLPGGRRLRQRTRAALTSARAQLDSQLAGERAQSSQALTGQPSVQQQRERTVR